jgi:ectoine hydroxylase-related dioxygenase (phytanoyl-CoA dioxygenase family)
MDAAETFNKFGFFLEEKLLEEKDFLNIKNLVFDKVAKYYKNISCLNDPLWVSHAMDNPGVVSKIYDEMRDHNVFIDLGKSPKIVNLVKKFIKSPSLYKKVPFRIDVPFETKELAFWHQDDFYVKGNDEELTVWIPLFDTLIQNGPLQVMPGSHKMGKIPHTLQIGKKNLPLGIYSNEIKYVEMLAGDALFFSSYLLHSSSINISEQIRHSIQLRYTSSLKVPSTEMKGTEYV